MLLLVVVPRAWEDKIRRSVWRRSFASYATAEALIDMLSDLVGVSTCDENRNPKPPLKRFEREAFTLPVSDRRA
jgi:hypothetical protein